MVSEWLRPRFPRPYAHHEGTADGRRHRPRGLVASSQARPAGAFGWIGLRPPVMPLRRFVVYIRNAMQLRWTVFPSHGHRMWAAY